MVAERRIKLIHLIIILMAVKPSVLKRNYYFNVQTCEVKSNDPLVCEINCTLIQTGKWKTITGFLNNLSVSQKFGAGAEIIARPLKGGDYMTIFNHTFLDLCPFLGTKKLNGIAQIAIEGLMKYGNLPKCPVEKGVYYLKNYYLSPEYFPPYAPEAEFKIKGVFFGNDNGVLKPCADWYIAGRIELTRNSFFPTNTTAKTKL